MPPLYSPSRSESLDRLAGRGPGGEPFDLVVIGGGATGLGVALDAAARGFSVALVEAEDFAKGTSSRATKLVHGGVRYLAQGNVSLVREALRERRLLLDNAPHLAGPLPFLLPAYGWRGRLWEKWFYGTGLAAYGLLAGQASSAACPTGTDSSTTPGWRWPSPARPRPPGQSSSTTAA